MITNSMTKYFIGIVIGIALLTVVQFSLQLFKPHAMGAGVPSNGDMIGIYNTTTTDLVLRNGFGSALAVDKYGRVIITTP